MKIQRPQVDARNCLNFSQVKTAPSLQEERFKPFVDKFENTSVESVLANAEKFRDDADWSSRGAGESRIGWTVGTLIGSGTGTWAALAGNPLLAAGLGVAATACAGLAFRSHLQVKKHDAEVDLAGKAHDAIGKAADDYAATLVCDGPGPDQFTDKRYYTGGIINSVSTVHSRESGDTLRTQVELGGAVPRKLEANLAKSTVSVRSPQGDKTFAGELRLSDNGSFSIITSAPQANDHGPLTQTIEPNGSSKLNGKLDNWEALYLSSEASQPKQGFYAQSTVWENGQVAHTKQDNLYVADPVVPFQDLSNVRILPDGVIGFNTASETTHEAQEAVLPVSHGIGTWSSVNQPQYTPRLLETKFSGGFKALGDQKAGTVTITAGDGSTLDTHSTLVSTNGAFRLNTRHTLGTLEQSLLPNEVLLNLQDGARTISVQHKSGSQPTASEHKDEDFISSGNQLAVSLDDTGIYWVGEGVSKIDVKPLMPLAFLEKKASEVAKPSA
ncbi:hypothetical protein ABS71_02030 [bacterium SCN 62-11]|nr:hypothetical protein [Candidatus Eremiobacteraeota bacterium]ODT78297.1 MAG: hypothetical protein ABS71_02030 [bacterium SCN 62-11]